MSSSCWPCPRPATRLKPSSRVYRLDTTLIDFTDMKCQRGDLSFIFNGNAIPSESFVVLDNEQKVYQRIHHEVCESNADRRKWRLLLQASHILGLRPESVYFLFIPANQDSQIYCQPLLSTSWRSCYCLFSLNNTWSVDTVVFLQSDMYKHTLQPFGCLKYRFSNVEIQKKLLVAL